MERIVIIGSAGAGKTTMAIKLASIHHTKVFHLDRFFWQEGWKKETRDERIDVLQRFTQEKKWIIEGTYLNSSKLHLKAADTIIFLDIPPLLCLLSIIKRHYRPENYRRRDIPEGCKDRLTFSRMLRVLLFPYREREKIEHLLNTYDSKQIIRLHSRKEVEAFIAKQRQPTNKQGTTSTAKEKKPVTV